MIFTIWSIIFIMSVMGMGSKTQSTRKGSAILALVLMVGGGALFSYNVYNWDESKTVRYQLAIKAEHKLNIGR